MKEFPIEIIEWLNEKKLTKDMRSYVTADIGRILTKNDHTAWHILSAKYDIWLNDPKSGADYGNEPSMEVGHGVTELAEEMSDEQLGELLSN